MEHETTGSETTETKAPIVPVDSKGSEAPEITDTQRDELASKLVDRFAMYSGAAGLIPVPFVDAVAVGGVQLQMLRRLSAIYGVPFTDNLGKSVIASLAGAIVPAATGVGVSSAAKSVPLIGTAVATLTMPAFSAGSTYLIGKVFIQHFASGGTLLDFDPPDYREFVKAHKGKLGDKLSAHKDKLSDTLSAQKDKLSAHKDRLSARFFGKSSATEPPASTPTSTEPGAPTTGAAATSA
jgi:uncharacterized protein (DUF697 family)